LGLDNRHVLIDSQRMPIRVGVDLIAVAEVADSLRTHSNRYLARVYTPREVDDCRGKSTEVIAGRLAARFAAKEAAIKVLRPGNGETDEGIPWNAIEVVRDAAGAAELEFSGRAAELALEAGLGSVSVSLTHEKAYAAAVVVAEVDRAPIPPRRAEGDT
jgi:holo-[acyl-carrier protein] synthase